MMSVLFASVTFYEINRTFEINGLLILGRKKLQYDHDKDRFR